MEKPTEPGWYVHCAAGYAGPYPGGAEARESAKGVGVAVRFRKCEECEALHTGEFSNCIACQSGGRTADDTWGDEDCDEGSYENEDPIPAGGDESDLEDWETEITEEYDDLEDSDFDHWRGR